MNDNIYEFKRCTSAACSGLRHNRNLEAKFVFLENTANNDRSLQFILSSLICLVIIVKSTLSVSEQLINLDIKISSLDKYQL